MLGNYVRTYFQYENSNYQLAMIGEFQALNASLAVSAIRALGASVNDDHIKSGLQNAVWPGRFRFCQKIRLLFMMWPITNKASVLC